VVGPLSGVEVYRTFVSRSYAFRSAVEATLQPLPNWQPLSLVDALHADMDDLGCGDVHVPIFNPVAGRSANLGRLYVMEGSSVGARLLYGAARKLGFADTHGARHLALQANSVARWKEFSSLIDATEGIERAEVLSGARQLFEFAIMVYSQGCN
jgi:heme oxygenase